MRINKKTIHSQNIFEAVLNFFYNRESDYFIYKMSLVVISN
jgi:hypothetical protein